MGSLEQDEQENADWLQVFLKEDRIRRGIEPFRFREEGESEQELEERHFRKREEESYFEF